MKLKMIFITVLLIVFVLNSCQDSGVIESNKKITPLEQDSSKWVDYSKIFDFDTIAFDGCFYQNNIILGSSRNIQLSTDKGATWSEKFVFPGATEHIIILQKLANGTIFTISRSIVYKSTDGGVTWINLYACPFEILGIQFINENKGFVFGSNGKVAVTTDAGITWTQLNDALYDFSKIAYDGGSKIYILNYKSEIDIFDVNTFQYTPEIISNDKSEEIFGLKSVNGNLWAYSRNTIYYKALGSVEWKKIYNAEDENIVDISFINQNIGYAVVYTNNQNDWEKLQWSILKTTNGGASWSEEYKIESQKFGYITFINAESENRIIASGRKFLIIKNQ